MKTYPITSPQNKVFKVFKEILATSGINKHGQALLFGAKATRDTLKAGSPLLKGVIMTSAMDLPPHSPETVYILDAKLFAELDIFGSNAPLLLLDTPPMAPLNRATPLGDGCHLAIPFQDPANLGALLRSAAAFDVKSILLLHSSAHPFHPRSVRAASGALLMHRYFRVEALKSLSDLQCPVIALGLPGEEITQFKFPKKFILFPGVEGPGLPPELDADVTLRIAMKENLESLNAMVATSIALHHVFAQNFLR